MRRFLTMAALICIAILATPSRSDAVCLASDTQVPEQAIARPEQQAVFTGTVEAVRNDGRFATVSIENVRKGPPQDRRAEIQAGPTDPMHFTSNDRRFVLGARYEFYPRNDKPPFFDDDCTATHRIGETSGEPGGSRSSATTSPSPSPGIKSLVWPLGVTASAAGAGVLLHAFLVLTQRQRRRVALAAAICLLPAVVGVLFEDRSAEAGNNLQGSSFHWGRAAGQAQATPGVRDQVGAQPWTGNMQTAINNWNPTPFTELV